ncbi:MAG: hypothetical protein IJ524_06595 [Bacteroidales bacterium]|nr:hypothetical protein [Bacteroidales bacterium]
MEYNELITRVQQAPTEAPSTDTLLGGMRNTLRRRRQQRQTLVSAVAVLVIGGAAILSLPASERSTEPTLAERVSRSLDTRPNDIPAPLLGYQHSTFNRQILTLI